MLQIVYLNIYPFTYGMIYYTYRPFTYAVDCKLASSTTILFANLS